MVALYIDPLFILWLQQHVNLSLWYFRLCLLVQFPAALFFDVALSDWNKRSEFEFSFICYVIILRFSFSIFFWRFLWEFSNAVWVAAVALFFHRWGKIRMLLPYQPVFKEEEPVIVGCSPSPTPLQLSQPSQLLPSSSLSQSQPPVPPSAVHVSANKFVSLDPAAIRRNQFMVS